MTEEERALIKTIKSAFPRKKWKGRACPHVCGECDEISEFVSGKTWEDLSAHDVFWLEPGPALFSTEAFAHFLPAFMVRSVEDPVETDVGFDNCLGCFLPHTIHEDPGHPVLDHLNERQTLALCDWLDWAIRGEIEQIHAIKDVEPYGGLMSRVLRKMTGDPLRRLAWHREIVDNLRASVADD